MMFLSDYTEENICDLWADISTINLNKEMMGLPSFSNGQKPIQLISRILQLYPSKNASILDFFAGSGSTGHAVLELNDRDKGDRKFILCTNNEGNIATDICYPRIKNVIKGSGSKKGFGGNLRYFKTAFIKRSLSRDDLKIRITRECTEMLCLRENIFDEVKDEAAYKIFQQGSRYMAVYQSLTYEDLSRLKRDFDKLHGEKVLYCFTLDPLGLDKSDFIEWNGVRLEPIPQKI